MLRIGRVPVAAFPNGAARVRAVRLHDLHHVATGYATSWVGEAEIGAWEREAGRKPESRWNYYACWQAAFEKLLASKGICAGSELEARAELLAARPPGHDH